MKVTYEGNSTRVVIEHDGRPTQPYFVHVTGRNEDDHISYATIPSRVEAVELAKMLTGW